MSRDRDSSRRSATGAQADRILEQALKHELRAAGTPPAGACLDAETLGAWTDGGLDPTAMAAAETHISSCARCQALVATIVKSTTLGTSGTPGTIGTLSLWKWWLAPIAAGVTAVTLWMVIPEQQELATAPPHGEAAQGAPPPVTAESVSPPATPPGTAADQVVRRDDQATAGSREGRPRQSFADRRKEKDEAPARQRQEQAALADAASPVAPPAPAAAAPGALAETVTVAPRENAAPPAIAALRKSADPAAAPIEIPTLTPARGWRIAGDRIERSDDDGKTWALMRQSAGDGLAAGFSPSNSVCWFVGRAGRVLLTIDSGATFTDVSLAENLDIAGVSATDAQSAVISTVSGRRFRTTDGGRTWRPF